MRSKRSNHTEEARTRCYSDLIKLKTFEERLAYLKLDGTVGMYTFGGHREWNQYFYTNDPMWKDARRQVITRDLGCDLGIEGIEILGKIYVHHMNPITIEDFRNRNPIVYDPEYLICTSWRTHQTIHYGSTKSMNAYTFADRKPFDTCEWKRQNGGTTNERGKYSRMGKR